MQQNMSHKKCAVLGCAGNNGKMYEFPRRDEARLQKWILASGNPLLLSLPRHKIIRRTLCCKHFEKRYVLQHRLCSSAIPTLCLPERITITSPTNDQQNVTRESYSCNIVQSNSACCSKKQNQDYMEVVSDNDEKPFDRMSLTSTPNKMEVNGMKESILEKFGIKGKKKLTPREQKIYRTITTLNAAIRRSRRRRYNVQQRLREAEDQLREGIWDSIESMVEPARGFFLSHIQNMGKKVFARRFTLDDKLFALSLYKKRPKCYKYIAQGFCFPSVKTIRKIAENIKLGPGLCDNIFDVLKQRVFNFEDERSKCCVLVFDEMKLEPSLTLDSSADRVEGFVDTGFQRNNQIADHIMVWMLKGIYGEHPWKQPVAYTFCKGTSPPDNIVPLYKEIVKRSHAAGLRIVASICDQSATNIKAIKNLIFESNRNRSHACGSSTDDTIVIDGDMIIAMYDPPHLLKCMRNNLLTKDLEFTLSDNVKRVAKWSHIETAYYIDRSSGPLRALLKLTDEHVVPEKIQKMQISKCTQVFSKTVASIVSLMSRTQIESKCGSMQMPEVGEDTAHLLLFLNDLFDTVNGGTCTNSSKHALKRKMSLTGPCEHEEVWNKAISVFQKMKFIPREMKDKKYPAVLKNWVHTLRGFKLLRKVLYDLGFNDLATGLFNQDCIENFFGQIRQRDGVRKVKPTCTAFVRYYKRLMFNALVASSTNGGNWEDEGRCSNLVELKSFLNCPALPNLNDAFNVLPKCPVDLPIYDNLTETAYICIDMFLRTSGVTQYTQNCQICLQNIMQNNDTVTEYKQISSAVSAYNRFLIKTITKITHVCNFYLPQTCHFEQLSKKLKDYVLHGTSFSFVKCEHAQEFEKFIITSYIDFFIRQYLMNVRKILRGSHDCVVNANILVEATL